ncbi:MAG: hypothetical protein R2784_16390 [Saprospiraceae bacterium]
MKKILLFIARKPKFFLFIHTLVFLLFLINAAIAGLFFEESIPNFLPAISISGIVVTSLSYLFNKNSKSNPLDIALNWQKRKRPIFFAYLGMFLFVAGSFPESGFPLKNSYLPLLSQTEHEVKFVLVYHAVEEGKKEKGNFLSRVNTGFKKAVHRLKNLIDPDPYSAKRKWLLAGVIIFGVLLSLALFYLSCYLACNGMGILAVLLLVGGELLYAAIAVSLVKKYWMKWRVKPDEK